MFSIIRRITFIILLCLSFLHAWEPPAYALESYYFQQMSPPLDWLPEFECISPFGPRPGVNGHDYHYGIDIPAEHMAPVYSVQAGRVVTAFTSDHDGGIIIIEHDKNWYSVYVDLQENDFLVSTGDTVENHQQIGYVGTVGGSHLHFAVRIGDPDSEGVSPTIYGFFAPWLPPNCVKDAEEEMKTLTWDAFFDFTGKVKEIIDKIAEACTKAIDLIKGIMLYVLSILMVIDICITMFMSYLPGKNGGSATPSIIKVFTAKVLLYGFLFFAVTNWTGFLANTVRDYAVSMGAGASGATLESAKNIVADPFSLVGRGAKIVEPIFRCFNSVETGFSFDFFEAILWGIPALFFFIIIFGSFILIAIMISIAYLEFYMVVVFSFTTFMFSGWAQTRRFAATGLSGLFVSSVKLLFITTFACLMTTMVNTMVVDNIVTEKEVEIDKVYAHPDGNFKSIEEFIGAIKIVESGGDYFIPSGDGWGYGAYQLSYHYFDGWCKDAGVPFPGMPWPDDPSYYPGGQEDGRYAWVTSCPDDGSSGYGHRSRPWGESGEDYHKLFPDPPNPWPPHIQDIVAKHLIQSLYDQYGNYHDAALAYNAGNIYSGNEEYWEKVCNAAGSSKKKMAVLNYPVVLLLALYCVFFVLIGDRVNSTLNSMFGASEFRFTSQ